MVSAIHFDVFILLGPLIGLFGALFYLCEYWRITAIGVRTEAEIVGNEIREGSDTFDSFYHPVIRFRTGGGDMIQVTCNERFTLPVKLDGRLVPIIYVQRNPREVMLLSRFRQNVLAVIVVGLLFFLIACLYQIYK